MSKINLRKKVLESFNWKKGPKFCARRIGISEKEYIRIRKEIRNDSKAKRKLLNDTEAVVNYDRKVNVEKGEATFTGTSQSEPSSPEEIIKILNIDTTKWKLSQYWNKQMSDHWRISALVSKRRDFDDIHVTELIKNWEPKKYKIPKPKLDKTKLKVCGIMSLQDIHFGKEGNETIDKDFEDAILDLIVRGTASHYIEKLYFVVGGDLINMDTFHGLTTKGTTLDNCMSATEAYIQAFDAMHWAVNVLKSYCEELIIVYIPGNHDRLSSFHLVHGLSKSIDCKEITWDVEYSERKVYKWHDNFNAFEHGDAVSKNTPLVYASEFPVKWGKTKNRTLFTGHFHQNRKIEYVTTAETTGFIHKTLPSLSKTDYYHYSKKYTCNRRSGKLELQSPYKGVVCEITYSAD